MVRSFIICTILNLSLFWGGVPTALPAGLATRGTPVVISPAYGHKPPAVNPVNEYDITRVLAQKVSDILSATTQVLVVPADHAADPNAAAEFANSAGAGLYICLHLYTGPSSRPMFYYFDLPEPPGSVTWQSQALKNKSRSGQVATAMAAAFKRAYPDLRPMVISAPVIPLEGITMAGVLIEPFSISQIPVDSTRRDIDLSRAAQALARAIQDGLSQQKNH